MPCRFSGWVLKIGQNDFSLRSRSSLDEGNHASLWLRLGLTLPAGHSVFLSDWNPGETAVRAVSRSSNFLGTRGVAQMI